MKIIYNSDEDGMQHEMEVDTLNEFQGANIPHLQVLKSAAGYYIGTLSKADWHPDFWEPNYRDSQCYWETREEAEGALKLGNYPIKF